MCNCRKPVTQDECAQLKRWKLSGMFIIYYISDELGLVARLVPDGQNPNDVATQNNFYNENGDLEWFHISEHPCNQ